MVEDPAFLIAYEASRRLITDGLWQKMEAREQAAMIYRAMRRIDAGNAPVTAQSPDTKPDGFRAGG